MLVYLASACEPRVVVGTWCPPLDADGGVSGGGSESQAVAVPWETSFEIGDCDYRRAGGRCENSEGASFEFVDAPARTGRRAAAFTVNSDVGSEAHSRCVLEGVLPLDAYYGAWLYVPAAAINRGTWNVFHFQRAGGVVAHLDFLFDISLATRGGGPVAPYVYDNVNDKPYPAASVSLPPIPIGSWFHLKFRLRRATDMTGLIELYQDDVLLLAQPGIQTERPGDDVAEWFLGNYADDLTPPVSTIYVDDVTVSPAP